MQKLFAAESFYRTCRYFVDHIMIQMGFVCVRLRCARRGERKGGHEPETYSRYVQLIACLDVSVS